LLFTVAGLLVTGHDGNRLHQMMFEESNGLNAVAGIVGALLAPAITWARPRHRVGWLLHLMTFTDGVVVLGQSWSGSVLIDHHGLVGGHGLAVAMGWISTPIWPISLLPLCTVLLAWYPDGVARTTGWRIVARGGWVATAAMCVGLSLSADAYGGLMPRSDIPFQSNAVHAVGDVLAGVGVLTAAGLGVCAVVGSLVRLHRAASPQREQLAWLLLAAAPVTISALLLPTAVSLAVSALLPLGLVVGIVKYQLLDIDVVLRRTLVYGALIALVLGVYTAVLTLLTEALNRDHLPAVLAAAVVAVILRPSYDLFARLAERYVYGDRHDPVRALSRIGDQLADSGEGSTSLESTARSVARSLRVAYVEIVVGGGEGAVVGEPTGWSHDVPLVYAGEQLGSLRVGARSSGEPLAPSDLRLVQVLAGPVCAAVRSTTLAEALHRSRDHLVVATEQERARLRHDLHDGLGPSLSGVALGLEAVAGRTGDPAVRELVDRLRAEVRDAVLDIRRLVDGLRPAALDAGGLVAALERHAESVTARNEGGFTVSVDSVGELPQLPAAVEVAAYRIALEAVTNAVRHAAASSCAVRLSVEDGLVIRVSDNGLGLPEQGRPGVGIESMQSRARELSGRLDVVSRAGHGTTVTARLPLVEPAMIS
jgi:signal transduction histidine kinase